MTSFPGLSGDMLLMLVRDQDLRMGSGSKEQISRENANARSVLDDQAQT